MRYEWTDREISGPGFAASGADFGELNPSAHVRYGLTDTTMLRFSVARTVLRPAFDQLTPAVLIEEPTDRFATQGNPELAQETAWGIDVGFDQRSGTAAYSASTSSTATSRTRSSWPAPADDELSRR